jgi:hypothetical protein
LFSAHRHRHSHLVERAFVLILLQGGLVVKVEDLDSLPYSFWGRWRQSIGRDWDFTARVDSTSNDISNYGVDLQLVGESTSFQANGIVNTYSSRAVTLEDVKVSQRFGGIGRGWDGMWTIVPRYNFPTRRTDVRVAYAMEDAMVTVDASRDKQTVTLTRRVNDNDVFINTVSTDREVEIEYRHSLGGYYDGDGTLSAIYKRDDSLTVQWEDGPWQASIRAPMDGLYTFSDGGVKLNIRRSIDLV